jgi:LemA protein
MTEPRLKFPNLRSIAPAIGRWRPTIKQPAMRAVFFCKVRNMFEFLSLTTLICIAAATICVGWLAICFVNLSRLRTDIDVAFEQIDVHLKQRHDLTPSLLEIVKQHVNHIHGSSSLIDNVMTARHTMAAAAVRVRTFSNDRASINSLVNADVALNLALERIIDLAKTTQSLRSDELFKKLTGNLNTIEENISFTRHLYNAVVNQYNDACACFPAVLMAAPLGFRSAGTLAGHKHVSATASSLGQA